MSGDTNSPSSGASWHFSPEQLRLVLLEDEFTKYSVDLRKITSSACMLDVVFDVTGKAWANAQIVGELIQQLRDLFDPQVNLCGGGNDQKLDPVEYLNSHQIN